MSQALTLTEAAERLAPVFEEPESASCGRKAGQGEMDVIGARRCRPCRSA